MKEGTVLSPGRGNLRQGGLKEGADLAGWRNGRKTSMSEDSELGDGRELVSKHWAGELEVGWKPWMVQGRGVMWDLKGSSDGH